MAIYAVGAYYEEDVSGAFVANNLVGVGWDVHQAPELHLFMRSLKVGDIVYIKAYPPGSEDIIVKAIGIIMDDAILDGKSTNQLVAIGRNVRWVQTTEFRIKKPSEKNNVRANTMYEEYHPSVQQEILKRM